MASVAMLRLLSEMRFSRSTLQEMTASGWIMAIRLSVFTAENLIVGLAEVRNIWRTGGEGGMSNPTHQQLNPNRLTHQRQLVGLLSELRSSD